jgi:hypothetical protein
MAAVATAAICRPINSLSDKLPGVISSPDWTVAKGRIS